MKLLHGTYILLIGLAAVFAAPSAIAQQHAGEMTLDVEEAAEHFQSRGYSPYADRGFPTEAFWGDTHLHTANSPDAFAFGNRLTPADAYKFARGETITTSTGQRAQLSRPLDWLVVADHGVAMGAMMELYKGNPTLLKDDRLRRWHEMMNSSPEEGVQAAGELISDASQGNIPPAILDPTIAKTVWNDYTETADQYNEPGRFTAVIGYEWSSLVRGNNLHRVVMFRGDRNDADRIVPFTFADSTDPEDLWRFMQNYEDKTGDLALAIPHNGNLSNGLMFMPERMNGRKFDKAYVEERARWEPVYEITQIKGDGEAHPFLSPEDEFADYETWDAGNLDLSQKKEDDMLKYEYAREALKEGLVHEARLGTNPFKLGFVGSTDSHTAMATAQEDNFFGKHTGKEPSDHRWSTPVLATPAGDVMGWEQASSGLAAAWATENTREAIWDAFKRREVYGTTGSRILVRFWGGWEFEESDALSRLPAEMAYRKGVPMGGDMPARPDGATAPTFLVAARKDPMSGNLDRIQIIKGWADDRGNTYEKVYDVVWGDADRRQPGADGRLPPVGNTVDVENVTWTNTIGDPELITVWRDPDFDPAVRAFYYARVIEIPTPRWTAYDAKRMGITMSDDVPMTTQERAYTSAIWYTPE